MASAMTVFSLTLPHSSLAPHLSLSKTTNGATCHFSSSLVAPLRLDLLALGSSVRSFSRIPPRGIPLIRAVQESVTKSPEISNGDNSVRLSSLFGDIEVLTPNGDSVPVIDLWKERRVVIAFARHFGCILCKKRAAQLLSKKEEFDKAGVALVIIGPGSPQQASAFKEQTDFPGEVYADPTHATFQKFEFVSGTGSIFTPKALASLVGAHLEGFRQDWGLSFQRDTVVNGGWQQGGVVVAGPGLDKLLFLFKDKEAGDEPNWDDVVTAAIKN